MPRVKSVKSLFQLCIAFIVPIIEDSDFPVKPSTNNEVAMIEPEVVVNPFHQLRESNKKINLLENKNLSSLNVVAFIFEYLFSRKRPGTNNRQRQFRVPYLWQAHKHICS
jgi:hypothetical protein